MVTIKDIEAKTMSPEKRQEAKKDLFAFYIGRPLSYLLTIPFINTSITPNQVSYLSLLPLGLGLGLMLLVPSLAGQNPGLAMLLPLEFVRWGRWQPSPLQGDFLANGECG